MKITEMYFFGFKVSCMAGLKEMLKMNYTYIYIIF